MESTGGPHVPQGFDSGLDDLLDDRSLVCGFEMTGLLFDDAQMLSHLEWPSETVSSEGARSQSQHINSGGSLGSPTGSSLIFTPTSTQLDSQEGDVHDQDCEEMSASPYCNSDNNIALEDYVYVNSFHGDSVRSDQESDFRSRGTIHSLLPSESSRVRPTPLVTDQHWQASFAPTSRISMDDGTHHLPFTWSAEMELHQTHGDQAVLGMGRFAASLGESNYSGEGTSLHTSSIAATPAACPTTLAVLPQQIAQLSRNVYNVPGHMDLTGLTQYELAGTAFAAASHGQYTASSQTRDAVYNQYLQSVSQHAAPSSTDTVLPHAVSSHRQSNHAGQIQQMSLTHRQRSEFAHMHDDVKPAIRQNRPSGSHHLDTNELPVEALHAPTKRSSATTNLPGSASRAGSSYARDQADRVRKGGRIRNSHLSDKTREKSSVMRRVGACWRCALQRDPCDHGNPCTRCTIRSQKGQAYFFDCDRSKLPELMHDFLPPSMTNMHEKQTIEDSVNSSVLSWDHNNGIDIHLSSGYGPALLWKVFEFRPRNDEYLNQLQYYHDHGTDRMIPTNNYSPPYGLLKIDTSDQTHLDDYLDQLLEPTYLLDFGWSFYEAESLADKRLFQAGLLDLMCKLYISTADAALRDLLKDILRMLLITYIMGHTLTISRDMVPAVIANVRHSRRPVNHQQKHTSPRLANRQLKFFFAILRNGIYNKLLKWQQATLHTAGKKDATWLPAFCVTLSFAMVLEEIQHTLFIQADASVTRGEMIREEANRIASNACERIDTKFKLLVGLFQCKYRDKNWGDNGSFGPGTPEVIDHASRVFLVEVREMIIERYDHLKTRQNMICCKENQCYFTSRLTAKFLLPFLKLPG